MTRYQITVHDTVSGELHKEGSYERLALAQAFAESHFWLRPGAVVAPLTWKQLSPTTWGLMHGQYSTDVLVEELPEPEERS